MSLGSIILASLESHRMISKLPKALQPVVGRPMVEYALEAAYAVGVDKPVLVVGYPSEQVRAAVGARAQLVEQREPLGTGHAVLQAREVLAGLADTVIVTFADMPLLTAETLQRLLARHQAFHPCLTLLTVNSNDPIGFGRIIRDAKRRIRKIVRDSNATPAELAISESNGAVYCFDAGWLWEHLPQLQLAPGKKEYFLEDLVELAARENSNIEWETTSDAAEVSGIDDRVQLARVEQLMRARINTRLMLSGVTLIDPSATYIEAQVQIGPDAVILPGTYIQGQTTIGSDCRIGPNAQIRDCRIGRGCEIGASLLERSTLEDKVQIGPYCHLRPGTYLSTGVHLGDHAELKNARLGPGTKMGHFSYLGDSEVGARVNIGAGTITCNYDGEHKHRTVIADDAFLGSDTLLVAPVTVGARAKTGAGAVVTKDIPPDSLVYGVPARVARRLNQEG